MQKRLSAYRIMWLMVLFDLPTETPAQRKIYAKFRKKLLENGFSMFQFSVYIRHCPSQEVADVYKRIVKKLVPEEGVVGIMEITDKQFSKIEIIFGQQLKKPPQPLQQLSIF